MKRALMVVALAALAMVVVASSVMAQDERPAPSGDRPAADRPAGDRPAGDRPGADRPRGERGGPAGMPGRGMMNPGANKEQFDKAVDSLKLEGEVKGKVDAVRKDFAPKFEEAAALLKKTDATREERMAAFTKNQGLMKEYQDAVKAALSDEQKKKLDEATQPPIPAPLLLSTIKENAEALKITEEQTTALKPLADEFKPAEDTMTAMREKMQAIRNSEKTAEEKQKAQQELMAEMQKSREAAAAKDRDCAAKVAKILNADQMKQAVELARKKMTTRGPGQPGQPGERPARTRGEGRTRPGAGGDTGTKPAPDAPKSGEPKPDGIVQ